MNTKLLLAAVIVLVGLVGYQTIQVNQLKEEKIQKEKEPKVTINIIKPPKEEAINPNESIDSLAQSVQKDFKKIITKIFENKELNDEIDNGVKELQNGLSDAVVQIQHELKDIVKEGSALKKMFKEGQHTNQLLVNKPNTYEIEIPIVSKESSEVKVDYNNPYLSIEVHTELSNVSTTRSDIKKYLLKVPQDGDIEAITSSYDNDKVIISIPKKVATH